MMINTGQIVVGGRT